MKTKGNYIATDDGTPIFLVGAYDYSPIHLGPAFWIPWVASMNHNANYVRIGVGGIDSATNINPYLRVPGYGKTSSGAGDKFDLTKFNPNFFKDLRRFIKLAQTNGVIVHVSLFNEIFTKNKPGCGFARNPFGNGNHINTALVGDVDRNHDGDGTDSNEFYDTTALLGNTLDKQRLAVAKLQRAFVDRVVAVCSKFTNVMYEIGNEVSDMNWTSYWTKYLSTRVTAPITVNAASASYTPDQYTHGITIHRIDYNFGVGKSTIRGLDSDGAGIEPGLVSLQVEVAWNCLVRGFGIYANYAEVLTRTATGSGFVFSNNAALKMQYGYFKYLLDFIQTVKLNLAVVKPHYELAGGLPCLAKPGRQYLVYVDGHRTCKINFTDKPGTYRVRGYRAGDNKYVGDIRITVTSGIAEVTTFDGATVLFINKVT